MSGLEEAMERIEAEWRAQGCPSGPGYFWNETGKFWSVYWENAEHYAESAVDGLTLYRAIDDKRVVGIALFPDPKDDPRGANWTWTQVYPIATALASPEGGTK